MLSAKRQLIRFSVLLLLALVAAEIAAAGDITQDDVDFRKEVYISKQKNQLPYRLFVPLGYDKDHKYPLLLWLHSGDGRGDDNKKQLTRDNQLATHFWISKAVQATFPAFVLIPQCAFKESWADPEINQPSKSLQMTMEVVAKLQRDYPIDAERIYVGGQAMGGLGTWSVLQKYPGLWAGALVISAYDNFTEIKAIAAVAVWVFQGDEDDSVPVTMVRQMVRDLKKAKGEVRYSEYHKGKRDIWPQAFAEPDLVTWLSAQRRKPAPDGQVGSGAAPSTR